ncbi:hypothetical protein EASAB2608_01884 [Streptomyces sp. EAS-AB2608]|uniref:Uncharacterized protein n=1 Tax=Streptomyces bangladeshensis TaxID=295352 RepID=A0ABP5NTR5_9ACTN|nr:hypothetical protein EASAB2608_01884 [Streptomyces sp. EAS-AB2608]
MTQPPPFRPVAGLTRMPPAQGAEHTDDFRPSLRSRRFRPARHSPPADRPGPVRAPAAGTVEESAHPLSRLAPGPDVVRCPNNEHATGHYIWGSLRGETQDVCSHLISATPETPTAQRAPRALASAFPRLATPVSRAPFSIR